MPSEPRDADEVSRLMAMAAGGDRAAIDRLLPVVYEQLRRAAQLDLARERPDHTLTATVLVHEAYLKLVGPRDVPWESRGRFYAAAAEAIIHRDIKPSNALVTLHDGVPVPNEIDFGIANATNSELTAKTLFTEHRQMIGAPAYMSPEQAEMSGLDIDTRSDVYSLGVLLYELLTGTTPFDAKKPLESDFNEMLRAIREDEPHKPSTRISSLGDTGTRTAERRRVELKKLSLLLRGDLDWIAIKCLEKDRSRRYETANGLAADIVRHLHDEPVSEGAPSTGYKLRKFVNRNRAQVIAASAVLGALLVAIGGTSWGLCADAKCTSASYGLRSQRRTLLRSR